MEWHENFVLIVTVIVSRMLPNLKTFLLMRTFEAAFEADEMRYLALVSHNEMKVTMKDFVIKWKNTLKFRNAKHYEVAKRCCWGRWHGVVFGPVYSSGPLGGFFRLTMTQRVEEDASIKICKKRIYTMQLYFILRSSSSFNFAWCMLASFRSFWAKIDNTWD